MEPEGTTPGGARVLRIQDSSSTYGIGTRQLLRLPGYWRKALRTLDRLRPDIIHCHNFDTLPLGLLWGKLHRAPVVYDAREYYAELVQPRLRGWFGRLLYRLIRVIEPLGARLCSAVITVDKTLGSIYRKYNRRVVIIGHYPNRGMAAQGASVFTRPEIRLLYTGRLSVDRGLFVYADLLRRLRAKEIPAVLVLAGVFTPPAEETAFRQRAVGLEPFIEYTGWVSYEKMPDLLRFADVGLALLQPIPRYVAALPVKLFEYMAAGLPVVASRFPLMTEIIEETGAGRLVDSTRPEEAARCITEWYLQPAAAQAAGENGRQAILRKYNWETLADRLADLYRSL